MTFEEAGQFYGGRVKTRTPGKTAAVTAGAGGTALVAILGMFMGNRAGTDELADGIQSSEIEIQNGNEGVIDACTGSQANADVECQLSATAQSLDAYWSVALPEMTGVNYTLPEVLSFTGSQATPCGEASTDTGPFYCPTNHTMYLDIDFFDALAHGYGAGDTEIAREYVVAHEFGHHIQQLLGIMGATDRSGSGIDSGAVRIELQADCYAGMWARAASMTIDPATGVPYLKPLTDEQVAHALDAVSAVGDDHVADLTGDLANPDTFTHGTSLQRREWFMWGYDNGSIDMCDAVNALTLSS